MGAGGGGGGRARHGELTLTPVVLNQGRNTFFLVAGRGQTRDSCRAPWRAVRPRPARIPPGGFSRRAEPYGSWTKLRAVEKPALTRNLECPSASN